MRAKFCFSLLLIACFLATTSALAGSARDSRALQDAQLTDEVRNLYNEAVDLYNDHRDKEALPKLKRVYELAPNYAPALGVYGTTLVSIGQYENALPILMKATELAPDWSTWKNLGVCYSHLGDLPNEVSAYKNALKISPDHPHAAQLQKSVKFLEAQIGDPSDYAAAVDAPDYLAVLEDKGFVRWPPEAMPLRVYIKDGSGVKNFRPELVEGLKKAFSEWTSASEGRLQFSFETDPNKAQIICSWTDNRKDLPYATEAGHAIPTIAGNTIQHATVIISTVSGNDDDPVTTEESYCTCLHEIGHVLGIWHSTNAKDVMFLAMVGNKSLSSRDTKTLVALYTMDKARLEKKRFDSTRAVQAGAESSVDMDVINLSNQAAEDSRQHNYSAAEEKLKRALQLKPGDDFASKNLCILYYNVANGAMGEPSPDKAIALFKRAIDFCKTTKHTDLLKDSLRQYSAVLKDAGNMAEAKTIDAELAQLKLSEAE